MIGKLIDNSRKDAHVANAQQVIAAAKLYDASEEEIDASGTEVSKIQTAGYLDQKILDPWNKEAYGTNAKVIKKDSLYSISGFTASKCEGKFKGEVTEQELANDGRELCKDNSNDG